MDFPLTLCNLTLSPSCWEAHLEHLYRASRVFLLLAVIMSFHFLSFPSMSFPFIPFHFISFHFISFLFISFHFISFHLAQVWGAVTATCSRDVLRCDRMLCLHEAGFGCMVVSLVGLASLSVVIRVHNLVVQLLQRLQLDPPAGEWSSGGGNGWSKGGKGKKPNDDWSSW